MKDIEWPREGSGHVFPVGNKRYVAVKMCPGKVCVADLLLGVPSKKMPADIDSAEYYEGNSKEIILPVPIPKPKKKPLTLVEILEEIKDTECDGQNRCSVCLINQACILFDCGHVKTCAGCSLKIVNSDKKECVYCRAPITTVRKVYL